MLLRLDYRQVDEQCIDNGPAIGFFYGIYGFSLKVQPFPLLFPRYIFHRAAVYGDDDIPDFDARLFGYAVSVESIDNPAVAAAMCVTDDCM